MKRKWMILALGLALTACGSGRLPAADVSQSPDSVSEAQSSVVSGEPQITGEVPAEEGADGPEESWMDPMDYIWEPPEWEAPVIPDAPDDNVAVPKELWGESVYDRFLIRGMCGMFELDDRTPYMNTDGHDIYDYTDLNTLTYGEIRRYSGDFSIQGNRTIPPVIKEFKSVQNIGFTTMQLNLAPELFELRQLQSLGFISADMRTIPSQINQLEKLKSLGFQYCNIEDIPKELFDLNQLEVLVITSNDVVIDDQPNLYLESLPADIGRLKQLRYLSLRGNHLTELPEELWSLESLEYLDLADNLQVLILDGNPFLKNSSKQQ